MLPTSTSVNVAIVDKLPARVAATAVLCSQKGRPDADCLAGLSADLRRAVARLIDVGAAKGKAREVGADWVGEGKLATRLLVAGLGEAGKLSVQAVREAGGALAKFARQNSLAEVAVMIPAAMKDGTGQEISAGRLAGAVVEGFLLGSFRYTEYRGTAGVRKDDGPAPRSVKLILVAGRRVEAAVREAEVLAEAQNFARTIASRPGNNVNPLTLAKVAQDAARAHGLKFRVLDEKQMKKMGMGGMLAVGGGAWDTPPRMIVLEHKPAKRGKGGPVLLVGKAITFDTGGISIKPADRMGRMIFDKCGGLAVLATLVAAARLKLPVHVVGILAAAENHISQRAYRPGDIVRHYNGVTSEVTNTDAEGRVVLADALAWGIEQYQPRVCLDLATLTGGVIVALGHGMAGVMGNDQKLIDGLIGVGRGQGEKMWQLPLPEEPGEMLKSDYADVVNSAGRDAQPLQGAAYLSFFVPQDPKLPWAHLDIAGVADTEKELPLYAKGATGWGVRTLVRWLQAV